MPHLFPVSPRPPPRISAILRMSRRLLQLPRRSQPLPAPPWQQNRALQHRQRRLLRLQCITAANVRVPTSRSNTANLAITLNAAAVKETRQLGSIAAREGIRSGCAKADCSFTGNVRIARAARCSLPIHSRHTVAHRLAGVGLAICNTLQSGSRQFSRSRRAGPAPVADLKKLSRGRGCICCQRPDYKKQYVHFRPEFEHVRAT